MCVLCVCVCVCVYSVGKFSRSSGVRVEEEEEEEEEEKEMAGDGRGFVSWKLHAALVMAMCSLAIYAILSKVAVSTGVNPFVYCLYRDFIGCFVLGTYSFFAERLVGFLLPSLSSSFLPSSCFQSLICSPPPLLQIFLSCW